jgi:hypothetical protein
MDFPVACVSLYDAYIFFPFGMNMDSNLFTCFWSQKLSLICVLSTAYVGMKLHDGALA